MKSAEINGFQKLVEKLTKQVGKSYCSVRVEATTSITDKREEKLQFQGYIEGYGWHYGDTPEEAVDGLKEEIRQKEIEAVTLKVETIAGAGQPGSIDEVL